MGQQKNDHIKEMQNNIGNLDYENHAALDAIVNQTKIEIERVLKESRLNNAYRLFILDTLAYEAVYQSIKHGGHDE